MKDAAEIIFTDADRFGDFPSRNRTSVILVQVGNHLFGECAGKAFDIADSDDVNIIK